MAPPKKSPAAPPAGTPAPTLAIAYCRISPRPKEQAAQGISLEAQEASIRAYAQLYNLQIVELVVDKLETAKDLDRPGLQQALKLLEAGPATALLVAKLDRLTRRVADLSLLLERYFSADKFALLSVGEQIDARSASGRMILNVLTSISQWERERISERTSEARKYNDAHGRWSGGPAPYGWQVAGKKLVEDPAEQAVIARARELEAKGVNAINIGQVLAAEEKLSRSGMPFQAVQIQRMLRRLSQGKS